ncbi:MAG: AMP-binding protein, partial [Candidatus Omnitrophica bacterium]|nr:AMP-binding protein [Candidatus Omnitrophota bacterium]
MKTLYEKFNSLGQMFQTIANANSENTGVIFEGNNYSYNYLEKLSNQIANFLVSKGVKKSDRIALCCFNSHIFLASYFGIVKAGASVVAINYLLNPQEIKFILSDSGAKGLIYHKAFEQIFSNLLDSNQIEIKIVIGYSNNIKVHPIDKIISDENNYFKPVWIDQREDLAAIFYTSGTTGKPKGVMLTHRNLLFDVDAIIRFISLSKRDIFISVLPMFHAFGATVCMLVPAVLGACIVAIPKFNPEQTIKTIGETRATIFVGVPAMYVMLTRVSDKVKWDFSSLRFCVSGGAALSTKVLEEF